MCPLKARIAAVAAATAADVVVFVANEHTLVRRNYNALPLRIISVNASHGERVKLSQNCSYQIHVSEFHEYLHTCDLLKQVNDSTDFKLLTTQKLSVHISLRLPVDSFVFNFYIGFYCLADARHYCIV